VAADRLERREAFDLGWWAWQVFAVVCVVATVRYLRQIRPAPDRGMLRPHHALFALIPLVVVLNGLTPYLELKTAYGWNMYANLRTVDGESNHLLVRRTFPVTDEQSDLVEIIRTGDLRLQWYVDREYSLTWRQLRTYLSDHPTASITYRRGGAVVSLRQASDRPELVEPPPLWQQKMLLFRAIDQQPKERCVPPFGPAR
jgi:hypothetical protein